MSRTILNRTIKRLMPAALVLTVAVCAQAGDFADVDFSGEWTYDWPAKGKKYSYKIENKDGVWYSVNIYSKSGSSYYNITPTTGAEVVFERGGRTYPGRIIDVNTIEFTRSGTKRYYRRKNPIEIPKVKTQKVYTIIVHGQTWQGIYDGHLLEVTGVDKNGDGFLTRQTSAKYNGKAGGDRVLLARETIHDEIREIKIKRQDVSKWWLGGNFKIRIFDKPKGDLKVTCRNAPGGYGEGDLDYSFETNSIPLNEPYKKYRKNSHYASSASSVDNSGRVTINAFLKHTNAYGYASNVTLHEQYIVSISGRDINRGRHTTYEMSVTEEPLEE